MSPPLQTYDRTHSPHSNAAEISIFRLILGAGLIGLMLIISRTLWVNRSFPVADTACFALFLTVLLATSRKPEWFSTLTWVVLLALLANVFDGLVDVDSSVLTPTHMLLPSIVMYGALLGNGPIAAVALGVVLTIYASTAARHMPLAEGDWLRLTSLCILSIILAIAAFTVWLKHRRLYAALRDQTLELQTELDVNRRLIDLISHDIANPLNVLLGHISLAERSENHLRSNIVLLKKMAERIADIIESVRQLQRSDGIAVELNTVPVRELHEELQELFESMLNAKGQTLVLARGGECVVQSARRILCHSILGNLVSNAAKFSPRNSEIEMAAESSGTQEVCISISDRGTGLPAEIVAALGGHNRLPSRAGTATESGTGSGLRIAQLCASRLGARISYEKRSGGGTVVSVFLPAATELTPDVETHVLQLTHEGQPG
jgi:signal transduction histidine kinase